MKKLFYKDNIFYLEDPIYKSSTNNNNTGKTHILKSYKITKKKMPHKYFKDHIVIYGRYTCPYCQNTIEMLKKNPKVIFVEVDTEPIKYLGKNNLIEILQNEIDNHTTVPIVFKDGKFIGGSSEVAGIV